MWFCFINAEIDRREEDKGVLINSHHLHHLTRTPLHCNTTTTFLGLFKCDIEMKCAKFLFYFTLWKKRSSQPYKITYNKPEKRKKHAHYVTAKPVYRNNVTNWSVQNCNQNRTRNKQHAREWLKGRFRQDVGKNPQKEWRKDKLEYFADL